MTEDDTLKKVLADSRVAPDYTMGAVARQTGVPSDTIRSWERRYNFPKPVRTDTNRRLYSERDIASVTWLREQTELGQGISEAIAMLKSRLSGATPHNPASARQVPATAHSPLDALLKHLREGDTEAAQSSWDELAIALSPAAITNALLKMYLALQQTAPADRTFATDRAHAFLLRKATVLLDHAGPDSGMRTFALIVASDLHAIPATLLASAVARCGHRVVTPFPVAATLTAVEAVHATTPNSIVLIGNSDEQAASFSRLLPGADIHRWNPDETERDADSLAAILHTLQNP